MGRVLVIALLLFGCAALGYFVRGRRNRADDNEVRTIALARDEAQIALHIAHAAIKSALRDPGLDPQTSVTLDDARQTVERVLPKGHLS